MCAMPNAPGDVSDVFTYTITDGDGDTDTATLTITLDNSTPTITDLTPEADGGDVTVPERRWARAAMRRARQKRRRAR